MKTRITINDGSINAPEPSKLQKRWLEPYFSTASTTNQAPAAAGTVYLNLFEVPFDVTVDAINIVNGDSVAGNVIVGVYGPIPTEETPLDAVVAVESASTALSGVNGPQTISLTPTVLRTGRYYLASEYSDTTTRYFRNGNQIQVTGWSFTYARGGGYGALTNPCPAPTESGSAIPSSTRVRIQN